MLSTLPTSSYCKQDSCLYNTNFIPSFFLSLLLLPYIIIHIYLFIYLASCIDFLSSWIYAVLPLCPLVNSCIQYSSVAWMLSSGPSFTSAYSLLTSRCPLTRNNWSSKVMFSFNWAQTD
ncbi:hypothetical protein VNO78_11509 [Psophocarpus tetragonolobus]|uniref:Uncharacterized protein n=1 Tax=Psophocarpus tetragonolobus TaxID=3891 RepID=A0AAN9SLK4_PSOTE